MTVGVNVNKLAKLQLMNGPVVIQCTQVSQWLMMPYCI